MPGSVRKLGTRRDGTTKWQARWRDPFHRHTRIEKVFRRREAANEWLRKMEKEAEDGFFARGVRGDEPWREVAVAWEATFDAIEPKTREGYESVLRKHLLPAWGRIPVREIGYAGVQAWVNRLGESLAPTTVRNVYAAFRTANATGVRAGLLPANPAQGIRLPRQRARNPVFLTPEEIRRLAEAMRWPYGLLVLTAAYTGLRIGELAGLRWSDLDLEGAPPSLTVRRAVKEVHGELLVGTTKNGKTRTVALPEFLALKLAVEREFSLGDEQPIFPTHTGAPLRPNQFYKREFKPFVERVLPEKRDLRFHDLRHTCASLLIQAGAHPKAIQERLGHSSIAITMDVYGHLLPTADADLASALNHMAA